LCGLLTRLDTTDMSAMPSLAMLGLILLVLGVYWLPSILAWARRHPDLVPIVVVNALFGWTIVGWVWAMAMLARDRAAHRQPAAAQDHDIRTVGSTTAPVPLEP
jgi:Superinfection immunity protein